MVSNFVGHWHLPAIQLNILVCALSHSPQWRFQMVTSSLNPKLNFSYSVINFASFLEKIETFRPNVIFLLLSIYIYTSIHLYISSYLKKEDSSHPILNILLCFESHPTPNIFTSVTLPTHPCPYSVFPASNSP